MKKCILFDLDGTLCNSAEGIIKSSVYALQKFNITVSTERLKTFIGPPLRDSFMSVGLSENEAEQALGFYRERYNSVGLFENEVYDGIPELLNKLKSNGHRLFVATSKPENMTMRILEHFDLLKYFEGVVGASLDKSRDSKEAVIEHLLKTHKINNAIMVGDTVFDVRGAKHHQIDTVGVLWGFGEKADLINSGAIKLAGDTTQLFNILADL